MRPRQQASAAFVKRQIETGPLPRNQIATISGLTNTYIRDLERGAIVNVERGKIIALGLGLNLSLGQLDEMLLLFDRAPLSIDDIPLFLAVAGRCKSTSVLLPMRSFLAYDLLTISAIRVPGEHFLVSYKPMAALQPPGYRRYEHRKRLPEHPLYGDLVEALGREMATRLELHLTDNRVDQYVSRHAMTEYLKVDQDPEQRRWHVQHVRQLMESLDRHSHLNFYLTEESSSFLFTLKIASGARNTNDRILISPFAPLGPRFQNIGLLSGFTTSNPVVVASFKEEVGMLKSMVVEAYQEKMDMVRYLEEMIRNPKA